MDELHNRGSPRLQFTKDELENDALSKPIARVEKAADKYDAAQKKLKKRYRLKLTREESEAKAQPGGQASGGGTVPGMSASGASRGASSAGTAARSPCV